MQWDLSGRARAEIETWLRDGKINLAIIVVDEPPAAASWQSFVQVQPVFLVRAGAPENTVDALLAADLSRQRLSGKRYTVGGTREPRRSTSGPDKRDQHSAFLLRCQVLKKVRLRVGFAQDNRIAKIRYS
jgi:hypothetical protein